MEYGIEVWGNTCKTNKLKLQGLQNKVLRIIVDAPWFIRNTQLHRDLEEIIEKRKNKMKDEINQHNKQLISNTMIHHQ